MGLVTVQIEHLEHRLKKIFDMPEWKQISHSRRWLKNQYNRWVRRQKIDEDDVGGKRGKRHFKGGWEY